jgi:outer membrane receptor for ferrienterochelin and colicin
LSNSLIYIDGKISTPAEMNAIPPVKIRSVDILKGEKLDDIIDAKGKNALISVQLKPNDLPEVVVQSTKPSPLYVVDGEIKALNYNLANISPDEIESINVIKGKDAFTKYGEAAKNGVVEITTKSGKVNQQLRMKKQHPLTR